jgi:hypothetical protein
MKSNASHTRSEVNVSHQLSPSQISEKWLSEASNDGVERTSKFLYYWIAFDSLMDDCISLDKKTACFRTRLKEFLKHVTDIDTNGYLEASLWKSYSNTIRILLDSRYTFKPYWDYQNGKISKEKWVLALKRNNRIALRALEHRDIATLIFVIFERIYTLRNQLLHGSFCPNDICIHSDMRGATLMMSELMPVFLELLGSNKPQEKNLSH